MSLAFFVSFATVCTCNVLDRLPLPRHRHLRALAIQAHFHCPRHPRTCHVKIRKLTAMRLWAVVFGCFGGSLMAVHNSTLVDTNAVFGLNPASIAGPFTSAGCIGNDGTCVCMSVLGRCSPAPVACGQERSPSSADQPCSAPTCACARSCPACTFCGAVPSVPSLASRCARFCTCKRRLCSCSSAVAC